MPLNLEQKKAIVADVAEVATNAVSAVIAYYRGLTVFEMNELRRQARASGVYLRVVPNTLAKRAFEGTEFSCLNESLVGPLILAFSQEEPNAAARLIRNFAKEHELLEAHALAIGGELLSAASLDAVATLPSRDEAIATLMSVLKAPIVQFVRTLAEPHAKFVRTVAAVRDQKQSA